MYLSHSSAEYCAQHAHDLLREKMHPTRNEFIIRFMHICEYATYISTETKESGEDVEKVAFVAMNYSASQKASF